jgi:hypothetical protein
MNSTPQTRPGLGVGGIASAGGVEEPGRVELVTVEAMYRICKTGIRLP